MKLQEEDTFYTEQEFGVAALVSRPLAKTEAFIGDNGTDTVDIIMTRRARNGKIFWHNRIS